MLKGGASPVGSSKGGLTGSGLMGAVGGAGGGLVLGTDSGEWRDPSAWQVGVANRVIMPHPHTEAASHAFVSITCLEVIFSIKRVLLCMTMYMYVDD